MGAKFAPWKPAANSRNAADFIIWDCFVIFLLKRRITEMSINNSAPRPTPRPPASCSSWAWGVETWGPPSGQMNRSLGKHLRGLLALSSSPFAYKSRGGCIPGLKHGQAFCLCPNTQSFPVSVYWFYFLRSGHEFAFNSKDRLEWLFGTKHFFSCWYFSSCLSFPISSFLFFFLCSLYSVFLDLFSSLPLIRC